MAVPGPFIKEFIAERTDNDAGHLGEICLFAFWQKEDRYRTCVCVYGNGQIIVWCMSTTLFNHDVCFSHFSFGLDIYGVHY